MKQQNHLSPSVLVTWIALFLLIVFTPALSEAQTFNSGSDGSDGVLDFTWAAALPIAQRTITFDPSNDATFDPGSGRTLDTNNDNVFHFSSIYIPAGVTVKLRATELNWAPVYWLATGNVEIAFGGTLDLGGQAGHLQATSGEGRQPAIPGPGGFSGGLGASSLNLAQAGFGPGAGLSGASINARGGSASHSSLGLDNNGTAGKIYGSPFLLPLVGGSGGAGGGDGATTQSTNSSGGGAGGGAIVIASSTQIVLNGIIDSRGGSGQSRGGGGSGGSVRLMSETISGANRWIDVRGNASANPQGAGRIRLEAFNHQYLGRFLPDNADTVRISGLVSTTPFLPSDARIPKWPTIHVQTINGISVSQEPSASFAVPDATVSTTGLVTVVFNTKNIPTNSVLTLHLISPDSGVLKVTPTNISGDETNATWDAPVSFPVGFTRGFLQATWAEPTP